eukprot:scaffold215920_cov41-Tisochrysis_lutea.AAC.2
MCETRRFKGVLACHHRRKTKTIVVSSCQCPLREDYKHCYLLSDQWLSSLEGSGVSDEAWAVQLIYTCQHNVINAVLVGRMSVGTKRNASRL